MHIDHSAHSRHILFHDWGISGISMHDRFVRRYSRRQCIRFVRYFGRISILLAGILISNPKYMPTYRMKGGGFM